jgi:pimeloyl-ACP methyl ester carboxylesterase
LDLFSFSRIPKRCAVHDSLAGMWVSGSGKTSGIIGVINFKGGEAMKKMIVVIVFLDLFMSMASEPRIVIREIPTDSSVSRLPVVPWILPNDDSWTKGKPIFEISDENAKTSAKGWIAVTNEYILLKIEVKDDVHVNHSTGGDIWDGDAVQLGIDALGDGTGRMPKDASFVGQDDAWITFALTEQGPEAWAQLHGRPGGVGAVPQLMPQILHNSKTKTTTYGIRLPWKEFQTEAGISQEFGLYVQVNDQDDTTSTRLYWGSGYGGGLRPGLFNRLAVGRTPAAWIASAGLHSEIWRASGCGEIVFAVASEGRFILKADMEGKQEEFQLPPTYPKGEIRRFSVHGYPSELPADTIPLTAVLHKNDGTITARKTIRLYNPGSVVERCCARLEALADSSTNPFLSRHFLSSESVIRTQWSLASAFFEENPQLAKDVVEPAKRILAGLTGDAVQWETYAGRKRSLILSFVSTSDNSLQYYKLLLPMTWDSSRVYPMVVFLHGAGDPSLMNDIASVFSSLSVNDSGARSMEQRDYFELYPWGRGNISWAAFGRNDVFDAVDDMIKTFKADEDRVYLAGHSMGGFGTWEIGMRTPDRWAAIAVISGGTMSLGYGMGGNACGLPVRIVHGEQDSALPVSLAHQMAEELRKNGQNPDLVIVPGAGHMLSDSLMEDTNRWLLRHTRTRPDSFSFIVDTDQPSEWGRNGIYIKRDLGIDPLPRFKCRVRGNTVSITTKGTQAIWIVLGGKDGFWPGCLGLKGDATVILNGNEAYKGPVKTLDLEVKEN